MPVQYEFFRVFEGSFFKAPEAVLFHVTAIHCHDGMDHNDASVFVLGSELLVCSQFEVPVRHKGSRNARARLTVTKKVFKMKTF